MRSRTKKPIQIPYVRLKWLHQGIEKRWFLSKSTRRNFRTKRNNTSFKDKIVQKSRNASTSSDDMKWKAYKNAKRHYGSKNLSGHNEETKRNLID